MAQNKYDVVVVGGGHNGLIVAAYLLKAGLEVCVVEARDKVGGAAISRELTAPGFVHDPGSFGHVTIQANPLLHRDELGLISKYGLKYVFPEIEFGVVYPDNSALVVYHDIERTVKSIAQFSKHDADIYPKFCQASAEILKAGGVTTFSPPAKFGTLVSFMDASEQGREFLRVILSSTMALAEEWFESDQMKLAICRFAAEVGIAPREYGTGAYGFSFPHFHRWGMCIPVGGSGALSKALESFIKDNKGTIKVLSPVKAIKVESGEAKSVVLENGEEIIAKRAIVSNVNVKQLFLTMLPSNVLPAGFQDRVSHIRFSSFTCIMQHLALNEAPQYKAGGDVSKAVDVSIVPWLEDFFRMFEEFTYGIPSAKSPTMSVGTLVDPTRAPAGKHTVYFLHFAPYNLKEGGAARWDEVKQQVADNILETLRKHTTNMGNENIVGRAIMSPLDLERHFPAMPHADFMHIGAFIPQFFSNRPLPGWGQYRTPVKKLYMCGASTHPGGGVTGGGRASVQAVMEDLGIDFKKVAAK